MENRKAENATVKIGDISIRLTAARPDDRFELDPAYEGFLANKAADGAAPDVDLKVHYGKTPEITSWEELFDAQGNWKLYRKGSELYMPLSSQVFQPQLYKMLKIDHGLSSGHIYIDAGSGDGHNSRSNPSRRYPLQYPLDEVLMVNLLSRGRGVEMHGLGIETGGKGYLFTGTSGAGKSTLAGLWKEREGMTILSDDRLIIRPDDNGSFNLFGTPWHGEAGISAYGGVPLERILVLSQSPVNRLVRLSPLQAAADMLVRCFPTFWDASGMDYTMRVISEVCARVPCYELQFKPEQAVLDLAVGIVPAHERY